MTFSPSIIDLDGGDSDNIEVKVNVPDNQATGDYFGEILAIGSDGEELDSLRLEVKVVGDVYIETV